MRVTAAESEAFRITADWIERGLAENGLGWYYWGYGEIVEGLRAFAETAGD